MILVAKVLSFLIMYLLEFFQLEFLGLECFSECPKKPESIYSCFYFSP